MVECHRAGAGVLAGGGVPVRRAYMLDEVVRVAGLWNGNGWVGAGAVGEILARCFRVDNDDASVLYLLLRMLLSCQLSPPDMTFRVKT